MRALVTGGGGFLGRHLTKALLDRGDEVVVLGRRRYPAVEAMGATGVIADLTHDDDALVGACEGVDVVFHAAALPPYHAPYEVFEATNVGGTRRVLDACRRAGVPRLVYTSTPSVAFDGRPAEGATEADLPYPQRYLSHYAATKADAERMALAAHGPDLAVTALRPRLIYGAGEPHMLPRLLERHRAGRLRIVGDGTNRVGLTHVDNAVAAHLQAAEALAPDSDNGGKAYFVTDPEPVALWPWVDAFLTGVGERPLTRRISLRAASTVGAVCEGLWAALPLRGEPPMTRFTAANLAISHWYDLTGGRRDFGLEAVVSGAEGLERTISWFREQG